MLEGLPPGEWELVERQEVIMAEQVDDTSERDRRHGPPVTGARSATAPLALATGIASVVLGILILAWPGATLVVVAVLFGVQLVLVGARRVALAALSPVGEGWIRAVVGMSGVLVLVLGLVCLRNPFTSVAVIAVLVALGWLIDGIADVIAAVSRPGGTAWAYVLGGVLSVVAAGAMLYWPALTITTLLQVGGWLLIFMGAAQIANSARGKGAEVLG